MIKQLLGLGLAIALGGCQGQNPSTIVIGSKNFTEQLILAELIAQQIEAKTDLTVVRKLNLGGTFVCHEGIKSGELDLYPEYTGTAYSAILKLPPLSNAQAVFAQVQSEYAQQFNLSWSQPLGFNNTFAMVVRGEDARQNNLTTLSDLAKVAPQWRAGFGYEFLERQDGFPGLAKTYNLQFAQPPRTMDLGLIYRALSEKQVDVVAGNSTDGVLSRLDFVILEDDRQYFPPYQAAVVMRNETLQRHPELKDAIATLAGQISETEMQQMNDQVDSQGEDVKAVVRSFLENQQLE
ncbi:glycine betaine ABC transporter substrate-binding protein [Lyngbya confervoides]|uniref:ABC transporter substrate-binding protein n=1 Tax=Lyngbya confervoides BDU141951 TaxID=1574623 RepID=A0ABD4T904_9CYAN|nr:glycine betaine ABC transporter substrate-binding protein [Lyngbya confervoides]MCM1985277.1 ABC transporter substrate-binding protein [Lyngbya confervoides BDU141951]